MARKKDANPKQHHRHHHHRHNSSSPKQFPEPVPRTDLAHRLRFPIAVAASLIIEWVLGAGFAYSGVATTGGIRNGVEAWVMAGWRVVEVGVVEGGGWGVRDTALLGLLARLPEAYLLGLFYHSPPLDILARVATHLLSLTLPFALFRWRFSSSPVEALKGLLFSTNPSITLLTASIYAVIAYASFLTYAPTHLAAHFYGIPDVSFTHTAQFPGLVGWFLPVGVVVGWFVYNPAAAVAAVVALEAVPRLGGNVVDSPAERLWQRLYREYWTQLAPRTKEIVRRTAAVAVVGGGNAGLRTWAMIEGVDGIGAAEYAGLWKLGAVVTGVVYWWVGNV
ncbi:MAG: hypothetical protein M1840_003587 [Geoglossum simile]|nr:MAG: hypothetical protein M1840_003587 [Geoglossum simile]